MDSDFTISDVIRPFLETDKERERKKEEFSAVLQSAMSRREEESFCPIVFDSELTEEERAIVEQYAEVEECELKQLAGRMKSQESESGVTAIAVPWQGVPDVFGAVFERNYAVAYQGKKPGKNDKLSQFELMELVLQRVVLRKYQKDFYVFAYGVFHFLPAAELPSLIMSVIPDAIRRDGNARTLSSVAAFLEANAAIRAYCTTDSPNRIYFINGALDFLENIFRPVGPLDFFTSYLAVEYPSGDKAPMCPNFDRFLKDVSGGDLVIIQTIWEMLGYIIVPGNEGKCFFFLQGVGNSGKSVLGSLIGELFNPEAVTHLDIFRLGGRFDLSALQRARVNISMDLANGRLDRQGISMIKAITGDDGIPLEGKFKDVVFAKLPCKMVFGSNFQLSLAEYDEAFLNRLVCIPFRFAVPPERQDKQLLQKLRQEKPAIVVRAIAAYKNLAARNFRFLLGHGEIGKDVCGYSRAGDTLGEFLVECCEFAEDAVTATSELYRAFCDFCKSKGYVTVSNVAYFSRQLNTHCAGRIKNEKKRLNGTSQNCYIGIRLKGVLDHE